MTPRLGRIAATVAATAGLLCVSGAAAEAAPASHRHVAATRSTITPNYVSDYETYTTAGGVRVHRQPSTSSHADYSIPEKGDAVDLKCWTRGTSVNGDNVWYYGYWMSSGYGPGYMSGYYVATGSDPNPNIRHC
jgi:hypothetical protein